MGIEDTLLARLATCHADACKEIEKSLKAGRSIGDAVADAIESLPTNKTRDIRRWLVDWEAWEEWQKWKDKGWRVEKKGRKVRLWGPPTVPPLGDVPPDVVIAAAAGVGSVHARSWMMNAKERIGDGRRVLIAEWLVSRLR